MNEAKPGIRESSLGLACGLDEFLMADGLL